MANCLCVLNDKIKLDWLNLSFETFKIKCKALFLACSHKIMSACDKWLQLNMPQWANQNFCNVKSDLMVK